MGADAETLAAYAARAGDYAVRFASARPDADLQAFIDAVPAGGRVLDLGCGPGSASAHMHAAGLTPDPVDASPAMVALANATFDIGARVGLFEELDAVAAYDGVWANFSLGLLHIGMTTGAGEKRDVLGRFYVFIAVEELRTLLATAGLRVIHLREGAERGLAGTLDPFVVCRAVKPADA